MHEKIATHEFKLEEKIYFKILIRTQLANFWWLYLLTLLLIFWNISEFGVNNFSTFLVLIGFVYPIFQFFYLYHLATAKKNRSLLMKRSVEVDEMYIYSSVEDGTENKVPFSKIVQFTESRTFFLLYISEYQFIYIPKSSFKDEADKESFESRVKEALSS